MNEGGDHWTAIGHTSNQLILYHPSSHALAVQPHPIAGPSRPTRPLLLPYRPASPAPSQHPIQRLCPTCSQPLPKSDLSTGVETPTQVNNAGRGYFQILEEAHEGSRPPSPSPRRGDRQRTRTRTPTPTPAPLVEDEDTLDEGDIPAKGYYDRYFREEGRLGMGAEGSVFLATHIIGGNVLGTYAVKKIAVGRSQAYLVKMLREVRLLEALRHPNIIPYHHSWVDTTQFSNFGPPIAALHVLMMYATAGNLDTYLLNRSNSPNPGGQDLSAGNIADAESLGQLPKEERIKAFKKRRQSSSAGAAGGAGRRKREENRAVLMLGLEEIGKLFGDVVEGLAFLHANSILHLDLKCSNVLLHWEEGKLIPKALLSDFGTSEEMLKGQRERTGHTGTMEYMAPETLVTDVNGHWRPSDSHADMWSLGLILYKLLFLHLPYPDTDDYPALLQEIVHYPGFLPTPELYATCERRHIPRDLLLLLSKLIHVKPESRPSAERVKTGLRDLESQARSSSSHAGLAGQLVARVQRFGQGVADLVTPPPTSDELEVQRWKSLPPGFSSPVQSVLALPSPDDERIPEPPLANLPRQYPPGETQSLISASHLRFALGALKILSVPFTSEGKSNRAIGLILLVMALVEIKVDRWSLTLPLTGLYLASLGSLLWAEDGSHDTWQATSEFVTNEQYQL